MPMKVEILQERENKPLARKEIEFRLEHIGGATPSRKDVKAKIVAHFDADASTVVIGNLVTKFGIGVTEGTARLYTDPERMKRAELEYILKRHESKTEGES